MYKNDTFIINLEYYTSDFGSLCILLSGKSILEDKMISFCYL